jgi:hypothetical protein
LHKYINEILLFIQEETPARKRFHILEQPEIAVLIQFSCRFAKETALLFFESLLTSEDHEISLLYMLWYLHSGGGVMRLSSIENGAQVMTLTYF